MKPLQVPFRLVGQAIQVLIEPVNRSVSLVLLDACNGK